MSDHRTEIGEKRLGCDRKFIDDTENSTSLINCINKKMPTGKKILQTELIAFGAAYGFYLGERRKLTVNGKEDGEPLAAVKKGQKKGNKTDNSYSDFQPDWIDLIDLIAVAETGSIDILDLKDEEQLDLRLLIFQEYANAGLCRLHDIKDNSDLSDLIITKILANGYDDIKKAAI